MADLRNQLDNFTIPKMVGIDKWKVEVGKMFLYVFIPIGFYAFFTNPANFENYIKKDIGKYETNEDWDGIEEFERIKREKQKESLEQLKERTEKILANISNS